MTRPKYQRDLLLTSFYCLGANAVIYIRMSKEQQRLMMVCVPKFFPALLSSVLLKILVYINSDGSRVYETVCWGVSQTIL